MAGSQALGTRLTGVGDSLAAGPSPLAARPSSRSELHRQNGRLRERYHEQQKRLVALRRSREACRRSNLALIEEIASLREQLQRRCITPAACRIELPEAQENAE